MVDMKIPAAANDLGIITHYRNTFYYIGTDDRRLSGLMSFQHTYLAKAPDSKIEAGNQKTKVINAIPSRLGDS